MQRPCTCEGYSPGSAYTHDQCRLCWLYHSDERYHRLWGGSQPPSAFEKLLGFARAVADHVAHGLPMADDAEKSRRLGICKTCPNLLGDSCTKCGCVLSSKAAWARQKCPENKW